MGRLWATHCLFTPVIPCEGTEREKKIIIYILAWNSNAPPTSFQHTYLFPVGSHLIGKGGGPPLLGIALTLLSILKKGEENQHDMEVVNKVFQFFLRERK